MTVKAPPQIYMKVVKGERPGTLRVFNDGKFGFSFLWGSYKRHNADGRVSVPPHITLPKGVNALPPGAPPVQPRSSTTMPRWDVSAR